MEWFIVMMLLILFRRVMESLGYVLVVFSGDGSVGFLTFAEIILKVLVLLCMSNETKVVFVIRKK